jgi:acetyl-CoA acetyltransferase
LVSRFSLSAGAQAVQPARFVLIFAHFRGFSEVDAVSKACRAKVRAFAYGDLVTTSEREDIGSNGRIWLELMAMRNGSRQAAITGVGLSAPGRDVRRSAMDLTLDAIDAGLTLADIDGIATFPVKASTFNDSPIEVIELKETLGIDVNFFYGGVEGPAQLTSIMAAVGAVLSGQARHVLCYRTLAQYTQQLQERAAPPSPGSTRRVSGKWMYHRAFNVMSPVSPTAMMARRHMHEFGTTKEQLGWIALNARRNAQRNPRALHRKPLTMDDYMNATRCWMPRRW